ncbi:MAG: hypothetical protein ABIO37_19480 [Caulobacteraceae bacterium]
MEQLASLRRQALPILGAVALAIGVVEVGWQWVLIAQRTLRLMHGG